jgi:5-methylcytosine-specific restriction protein A
MPYQAKHPCAYHGCPNVTHTKYCAAHSHLQLKEIADKRKESDARRGTSSERGYGARWGRVRKAFLASHPLCSECAKQGLLVSATDVHHKIAHQGNYDLMWDESNFESLCHSCHSKISAFGNEYK